MAGLIGRTGARRLELGELRSADNHPALDAAPLQRVGALVPGTVTPLRWVNLSGVLRCEPGHVLVEIAGEPAASIKLFPRSAPAGGGEYMLFVCPICYRPFQVLRVLDCKIACRRCHRMTYASRREIKADPVRKAARLRLEIGAPASVLDPLPVRPKDQRAAIEYDRVVERIVFYELQALAGLRSLNRGLRQYVERRGLDRS